MLILIQNIEQLVFQILVYRMVPLQSYIFETKQYGKFAFIYVYTISYVYSICNIKFS